MKKYQNLLPDKVSKVDAITERMKRNYSEQYWYGDYFLKTFVDIDNFKGKRILEVGCSAAGLLRFFDEKGASCWGVDVSKPLIDIAKVLNDDTQIKLFHGDICNDPFLKNFKKDSFDLIVMREVIEHLENPSIALAHLKMLLKNDGSLFISCPSKWSPYSGHQQIANNLICKLPYFYLLPGKSYPFFLKVLGENIQKISFLVETKSRRISISMIKSLIKNLNLELLREEYYFIRPAYKFRFNYETKRNIFFKIPILGDMFTNGMLFLLKKRD